MQAVRAAVRGGLVAMAMAMVSGPCLQEVLGAEPKEAAGGEPLLVPLTVGRSADGLPIPALVDRRQLSYEGTLPRVLLVGMSSETAALIRDQIRWFATHEDARDARRTVSLAAIPDARPGDSPRASAVFPPPGIAYREPDEGERISLWRWIGMLAPDLVVVVQRGQDATRWSVPAEAPSELAALARELPEAGATAPGGLATALVQQAACETGRIPAIRVQIADGGSLLPPLLDAIRRSRFTGPSEARRVLQQRTSRTAVEVASQLSNVYGHDLKQVVYIPALALVGRLRLGERTQDGSHQEQVLRITRPYFTGMETAAVNNGSALSGHLVFCELAQRTTGESRQRWIELARRAADLAWDEQGQPRELMPHHSEMSDALFMGGPILAHVGQLTGESRYFDACMRHLRSMRKLVLRPDGLYRHSPLDDAAWGRGNGFPALGLAWCLSVWPEQREDFAELREMFRDHLRVLLRHQDATGCWHQVVDHPESYRELSCTSMITFAMARGVDRGWLDAEGFESAIEKGWHAVRARVAIDGRLVDVCTGTGKQRSLRDYYHRQAILGPDARGGAMALLLATELAGRQQP